MIEQLFSLKDRVALVTGGSRGIGKMIAAGFVAAGAKVYITSRKAEECVATARELASAGSCVAIPHDVSTLDGCRALTADYLAHEHETYSYQASEAALIFLTRRMAAHLVKDFIVVSAIAPGPFASID